MTKVNCNQIVFEQGSTGLYFYIIKSGKVDLLINKKHIKSLHAGDHFGDLALLHEEKRSGTILAIEETMLWGLDSQKFRAVIKFINEKNQETHKKLIQSNKLLSNI